MNERILSSQITGGGVLKYTFLPGIWPRLKHLFNSGFSFVAICMLSVFLAVRLLPPTHPYLRPENREKLSIFQVMAAGGRNVVWDLKHIDQALVYVMILVGFIALIVQFLILAFMLLVGPALAAGAIDTYFVPANPEQDYALRLLDLIFGVPAAGGGAGSFFGSCVAAGGAGTCLDYRGNPLPAYGAQFPFPVHAGLHSMLEFYNWTIIIVGFLILIYYIVTLLAETTVHGTFWGQRANTTWVPVRLIIFFALILPVPLYVSGERDSIGFNTAQVVTLNVAYFGTGMASNIWQRFNEVSTDGYLGNLQNLIARPSEAPSINGILQYMSVVKTCKYGEAAQNYRYIDAYIVRSSFGGDNCLPLAGTTFENAKAFALNDDIHIRFGERAKTEVEEVAPSVYGGGVMIPCQPNPPNLEDMEEKYKTQLGYVMPHCGEITIPASSAVMAGMDGDGAFSDDMEERNFSIIQAMWQRAEIDEIAQNIKDRNILTPAAPPPMPDVNEVIALIREYQTQLNEGMQAAIDTALDSGYFDVPQSLTNCGWFCAAIWYNRVAEINGVITSSVFNMPNIVTWPRVMAEVQAQRNAFSNTVPMREMFAPTLANGEMAEFDDERDQVLATMLNDAYTFWYDEYNNLSFSNGAGDNEQFLPTAVSTTGNPVRDMLSELFGLSGLYDMRQNPDVHPLAQLSVLGKSMIDATVRNFGLGMGATIAGRLGGMSGIVNEDISDIMQGPVASFMLTFGMISLTIGFVLFYVLPFLPFIYFFFAVSGWIQSIFEAMVGLPLWALAHLRIDGQGMIPQGATSGYFLILDILLRPTLVVFSLVGCISIFSGMVHVLNEMYDFVSANIGGYNLRASVGAAAGTPAPDNPNPFDLDMYRSPIDQFFFTVTYAIIVYMMATSIFKLIDMLPNNLLRWMGESVKTFGELDGDPANELLGKIQGGITLIGLKASGALGGLSSRQNIRNSTSSDPEN